MVQCHNCLLVKGVPRLKNRERHSAVDTFFGLNLPLKKDLAFHHHVQVCVVLVTLFDNDLFEGTADHSDQIAPIHHVELGVVLRHCGQVLVEVDGPLLLQVLGMLADDHVVCLTIHCQQQHRLIDVSEGGNRG